MMGIRAVWRHHDTPTKYGAWIDIKETDADVMEKDGWCIVRTAENRAIEEPAVQDIEQEQGETPSVPAALPRKRGRPRGTHR